MATLSSLLSSKSILTASSVETNLEAGRVWGYSPQNHNETPPCMKFYGCQITNDASFVGTVEVEVWGPGGRSNGCSCCCGGGVGGNPGAYMSFKIPMTKKGFIYMMGGRSCSSGAHCHCGGQGNAVCLQICSGCVDSTCTYACACACVQSGLGGRNQCINGGSMMCCLGSTGACITPNVDYLGNAVGDGCGMVCNVGNSNNWPSAANLPYACYCDYATGSASSKASITGVKCCNSDITRAAKTFYGHCNPAEWNYHRQIISTAPMRYSTCGAEMVLGFSHTDGTTQNPSSFTNMDAAVQGITRSPTSGHRSMACWASIRSCGCYEETGCTPFWPIAMPAPFEFPCSGVRTHGYTGGHGAMRIKYLGEISVY